MSDDQSWTSNIFRINQNEWLFLVICIKLFPFEIVLMEILIIDYDLQYWANIQQKYRKILLNKSDTPRQIFYIKSQLVRWTFCPYYLWTSSIRYVDRKSYTFALKQYSLLQTKVSHLFSSSLIWTHKVSINCKRFLGRSYIFQKPNL